MSEKYLSLKITKNSDTMNKYCSDILNKYCSEIVICYEYHLVDSMITIMLLRRNLFSLLATFY